MNTKEKTKLLTMSLLCCGRADTTEKCLKSLMPIREAVDSEIIVVDTGCDKETRAIVDEYADEVIEFTWCGDFAKARNVQIDAANGKWFLFLDDDEFFIECQEIIDFFNSGDYKKFGFGGYFVRNYHNFQATEWTDSKNGRLIAVTPEVHFEGMVHEKLVPKKGDGIYLNSYAGHFGYVYSSREELENHTKRNIELLLKMLDEKESVDLNIPIQLAQEYRVLKFFDEMYDICFKFCQLIEETNSKEKNSLAYGILKVGLVISLEGKNDYEGMEKAVKEIIGEDSISEIAKSECLLHISKLAFVKGDFTKTISFVKEYLECKEHYEKNPDLLLKESDVFLYDTFKEESTNNMYFYIMASGIKTYDYTYLKEYCDKIAWKSNQIKVNKGYLIYLLEAAINNPDQETIIYALYKFSQREELKKILKYTIKNELLDAPDSVLNSLKLVFLEDDFGEEMIAFINAVEIGARDKESFEKIYNLEEKIIDEIGRLKSNQCHTQIEDTRNQLQNIILSTYGVKTLH